MHQTDIKLRLTPDQVNLLPGPRIIALDPGQTTGWAGIDLVKRNFQGGFVHWPSEAQIIVDMLNNWDVVVVEDFRIYSHKAMAQIGTRPPSVEVIGFLRGLKSSIRPGINLVFQMASVAKQMFPDKGPGANAALKDLMGDRYPTNRHTRDATRHLFYYIIRTVTNAESTG